MNSKVKIRGKYKEEAKEGQGYQEKLSNSEKLVFQRIIKGQAFRKYKPETPEEAFEVRLEE